MGDAAVVDLDTEKVSGSERASPPSGGVGRSERAWRLVLVALTYLVLGIPMLVVAIVSPSRGGGADTTGWGPAEIERAEKWAERARSRSAQQQTRRRGKTGNRDG